MRKGRSLIAMTAAGAAKRLLRLFRRGATTFPGKLALTLAPDILPQLTKDHLVVLVTGTNGKTTTTHILTDLLRRAGYVVASNVGGANMASGHATALIDAQKELRKAKKAGKKTACVLETDEGAFAKLTAQTNPTVCLVTNLFRDQLDRYGEVAHTREFIQKGLLGAPEHTTVVLNADDSLVASLGRHDRHRIRYFGLTFLASEPGEQKQNPAMVSDAAYCPFCKAPYIYRVRSIGHLGDYACSSCDYARPIPDMSVAYADDAIHEENRRIILTGQKDTAETRMPIPGDYNLYNVAAAAAVLQVLQTDVPDEKLALKYIASEIKMVRPAFGRMEKIEVGNKKMCVLLVKNPVGLESALTYVSKTNDRGAVFLLLNNQEADGQDISWIWDVDFESKDLGNALVVSGERYAEMRLRLTYAGVSKEAITAGPMADLAKLFEQALSACPEGRCLYMLPNYTAMFRLRTHLAKKYNLKNFWEG